MDDEQFQAWANRVKRRIDTGELKKELTRSVKRIGKQAIRQFKANTPEDTGHLRRCWRVQDAGFIGGSWSIELTNGAEYASYVENGHKTCEHTGWVPGQFFMKESLDQVNSQLPELITPGLWAFRDILS
ncbi:hypothetical protein FC39_GL000456 [Lactobacillus hamsteri DSM 5661 = JCM 6256]|uniref:HK97 gp10 family phage protein n=1 Tax=Lactobacillus hamsteri DSM 5661 = JCM 6256 TaxID=1423754 RepID=A0A0R1YDT5_9LACO|nr:hypothetical protein FC39_GL000456 [Lactobacillus hamsteri DSM 5661 = JCM 6256]